MPLLSDATAAVNAADSASFSPIANYLCTSDMKLSQMHTLHWVLK